MFVLLLGNLGSHHSSIPVEIFRGFALADPIAPDDTVINDRDARAAWSFTALHELVHLWLGDTGISGVDAENHVEQYCNDVAGEILLPAREGSLRLATRPASSKDFDQTWSRRSRTFAPSATLAAPWSHTSSSVWGLSTSRAGQHSTRTSRRNGEFKQREAEKSRASESGPNYYVVRRHRVGPAVLEPRPPLFEMKCLTYPKAGRVLGVEAPQRRTTALPRTSAR